MMLLLGTCTFDVATQINIYVLDTWPSGFYFKKSCAYPLILSIIIETKRGKKMWGIR